MFTNTDAYVNIYVNTVDDKKLEHGCSMIYACLSSSFGIGIERIFCLAGFGSICAWAVKG